MRFTFPQILLVVVAAGAAVAAQAQQPVQQEQAELKGVYSFVGALDGEATLFAARSGAQSELEIHLPILRGDRIWTRPYGRLAVLMSDRSILALDHDSDVTFTQIAGSPDADDVDSLYVLHRGRLSLDVADHLVDSELPAVDTTNARIYARQQGRYQVESDGDAWTEVAVLEGFAEIVTQRGSVIVRGGEALRVQGLDDPWIELQNGVGAAAAALDEWTDGRRARLAAYAAVDANGYGSALASHGNWVEIEDRQAWKPEVEDDWQPYSRGRWTDTPAGLYWVARDPWGPLTYHYGSWNLYPGHGWLWFPSSIYSPSHVYWYWGPSYVGWIPRGYYQRYYGGLGFGLRRGLYGWAGGFWDPFNTWIFCPSGYLGYGRGYTYGRSLRRRHPKLSRGIITTDTNGIDYRNWRNPDAARQVLLSKRPPLSESQLPDVTDFVARRADLTESLQRRLVRDDTQSRSVTVTGGPSGSGSQGLVGVTAGGVRAAPVARVTGAGGSSGSGVAVRRTGAGQLRPAGSGTAESTPQLRRAGSVPTDAAEPSDAVTRVRRADTPGPASVSSGGVKAAPAPRAAVKADEPGQAGAVAPTRVATPRSSGGTLDRSRRPTPGRRVLDAIRGRDAAPVQPRTAAPASGRPERVNTPRSATPPRTRATTPRTSRPATPPTRTRSAPPRTSRPATPPTRTRSAPPRTSRPATPPTRTKSAPPRTSRPSTPPTRTKSAPPRTSRPSTPPTRTKSAPPRTSRPATPPTRTKSAPPRTSRPATPPTRTKSAPPRTSRPSTPPTRTKSAPPRTSRPATPPTRTRSTPTRTSRPRSTPAPRTRSTPRTASPRSSSPPARSYSPPSSSSAPRASSPPPTASSSSSPPSGSGRTPPRLP